MKPKQIRFVLPIFVLAIIGLFLVSMSKLAIADVVKSWEIDIGTVFHEPVQWKDPDESKVSELLSPVIVGEKVIIGNRDGRIKTIDIHTREIQSALDIIPFGIREATRYGKNVVVFTAYYKTLETPFYCAVNVNSKKLMGTLKFPGELWKVNDLAIFQRKGKIHVFNPLSGTLVYEQPVQYQFVAHVRDSTEREIFWDTTRGLVELRLPGVGGVVLFQGKNDVPGVPKEALLNFVDLGVVGPGMIPDLVDGNRVYYHRKNGVIGVMAFGNTTPIWEKSYFKRNVTVLGPHVFRDMVFYLVSYPRDSGAAGSGKIICLNRKRGQAVWLSEDILFQNLNLIQFRNTILATDPKGNLRFLDIGSGRDQGTFPIEGVISKPFVDGDSIYFQTGKKIYRFDFKGAPEWLETRRYTLTLQWKQVQKWLYGRSPETPD